ncbi:MAG: hypothetical protein QXO75_09240 [Nitrososphaerota archaeon]
MNTYEKMANEEERMAKQDKKVVIRNPWRRKIDRIENSFEANGRNPEIAIERIRKKIGITEDIWKKRITYTNFDGKRGKINTLKNNHLAFKFKVPIYRDYNGNIYGVSGQIAKLRRNLWSAEAIIERLEDVEQVW